MDKRRTKGTNQPDLKVLPEEAPPRLIAEDASKGSERLQDETLERLVSPLAHSGKSIAPSATSATVTDFKSEEPQSQTGVNEPEDAWGRERNPNIPVGWLFLGCLLLLGLAAWSAISLNRGQDVIDQTAVEKNEIKQDRAQENQTARKNLIAMRQVARGFLAADSIEDQLAYVRQPELMKPLMEKYYQRHDLEPKSFIAFRTLNSIVLSIRPFLLVVCTLENGEDVELLIEEVESGSYQVDWETFVHYQPMPWVEFLKSRTVEPLNMRVICSIDNFYAYEFRDESKYQCYKLTSRVMDDYVYAYVARNSRLMYKINYVLNTGGQFQPMILSLRFPDGGNSKRSVVIADFLSGNWTHATYSDE